MSAAKKIILLLWLVILASLGNASALTPGTTETCVGEKTFETLATRQAEPLETAGRHQENGSRSYEVAPDSLLAAEGGVTLTQEGIDAVSSHLSQFDEFAPNTQMVQRLQSSFDAGQDVTGADANFFLHETSEANFMSQGLDYDAAHAASLELHGASPFSLYAPEVIDANPTLFNNAWRTAAGLSPLP